MGKMALQIPILYIPFIRLDVVKKTFPVIAKQKPKQLFVADDGPRTKEEKKKTDAVRKYILKNVDWDCELKTRFLDKNLGCKDGVCTAVDWFFENVEEGIILEEDCLANESFFKFSEEMLKRYKNNSKVFSIGGYNYLKKLNIKESYYFSRYFECWGWASWRDRWQKRDVTMGDYLADKKSGQFKKIMKNPIERYLGGRELDTILTGGGQWDHPFGYLHSKNNGVSIKPNVNLIKNIGFTKEDAAHTPENFIDEKFYCIEQFELDFPLKHPVSIEVNSRLSNKEYNKGLLRLFLKKFFGLFGF